MGELSDFQVGQTVQIQDGRTATVQFIGSTHFADGDWVGLDLDDATGKNDGAVQGQRYFDCAPGHGMFVRPGAAIVVDQQTPKPNGHLPARANGAATRSRPQSMAAGGLRRQSVLDPASVKRQSINAGSPTPGSRFAPASRLVSPSKSPTKQLGSMTSSGRSTPRTTAASSARPSTTASRPGRTSMGPPPPLSSGAKPSRHSVVGSMNGLARVSSQTSSSSSRAPSNRMSIRPSASGRLDSVSGESHASAGSGQDSPAESLDPEILSPPVTEARPSLSLVSAASRAIGSDKPATSRSRSPPHKSQRVPPPSATPREVEDLRTKLRVMEKRRIEDRERLKTLERIQIERDKFEGIIQKLQNKYQPQQQEITDLKRRLKEEEAKAQAIEAQQAENETLAEMATLDREMAEETADSLKTELDALRQKHEELELEVEILREENQELGKEMSPEEKTSQGWLQMERSNERLREALVRLRDVTQQQETDLKAQVLELEKDMEDLGGVKDEYLQTKERLAQSDAAIEDLRQQLETALGAEEMIEELAEKNMALNEQIDDLRAAVEDLESLKELNDELDLNHTETQKQMQDEIDYNETILADKARKSAAREEIIQDLEYTVTRFRDLVTNMQNDLEDMRASQQITETEATELTSRSRAMMDLNMRLQVSASKAQVKAIDLELQRMEAQESTEHLAILQLFLPDSFKVERDSIRALLRFKRIGFKADMMHGSIKERLNSQATANHEDDIFARCDILDKLTWVSGICDRFISFVQTCSLEAFTRLEGALYDLEPVERAFNGWIDALKRDDLKEGQCAEELQRSIALMTHLSEVHISDGLERFADDIYMRALMMQSHLESAAAALSHVKSMSRAKIVDVISDKIEDDEEPPEFLQKVDFLISQSRSAKVITSKAIRELEELKSRSLTLDPSTLPVIEQSQSLTSDFALSARAIGNSIFKLLNEEGRTMPLSYQEISFSVSSDNLPFSDLSKKLHTTITHLQTFYGLTSSLTQTIEFISAPSPPPWELLAQNLRAATSTSASHKTDIMRLKDEILERNTALAMKEKVAEEMSVKVEVLEKRVGESGGRRERVRELEGVVSTAKAKEKDLTATLTRLQHDLRDLEAERDTWTKSSNTSQPLQSDDGSRHNDTTRVVETTSESSLRQIADLKSEIQSLQSTIRYFRSASYETQLSGSLAFLSTPITPPSRPNPSLLQQEAQDVLKEMLTLVTRPENKIVQLQDIPRAQRLKWTPARETSGWKVKRQREEWEGWREWMDEVSKRGLIAQKEAERRFGVRNGADKVEGAVTKAKGDTLASVQFRLPEIDEDGHKMGREVREVRIVKPEEWEEVQEVLGVV